MAATTSEELSVYDLSSAEHIKAATELMTPRDGDFSVALLDRILGPGWQDFATINGGGQSFTGGVMADQAQVSGYIFAELLGSFNTLALAALVILFVLIMATGVLGTAHEGEPLGKRYSTLWTPMRAGISVGMLVPLPWGGGYSILQTLLMLAIYYGIGGANVVNDVAMNHFVHNHGLVFEVPAEAKGDEVILSSRKSAVTMSTYIREMSEGGDGTVGTAYYSRWVVPSRMEKLSNAFSEFLGIFSDSKDETLELSESGTVTKWVEHQAGETPCNVADRQVGYCEIVYAVPKELNSKARVGDHVFGAAKIECSVPQGTVCEKRLNTWAMLQHDAFNIANALTQPLTTENPLQSPRGYFDILRRNFEANLSSVAVSELNRINRNRPEEIAAIGKTLSDMGWAALGSYQLKIAHITEESIDELGDLLKTAQYEPNVEVVKGALVGGEDLQINLNQLTYQVNSSARAARFDYHSMVNQKSGENEDFGLMGDMSMMGQSNDWYTMLDQIGLLSPFRGLLLAYISVLTSGDPASNLSGVGHFILNGAIGVSTALFFVEKTTDGLGAVVEKVSTKAGQFVSKLGNIWDSPLGFLLISLLLPLIITGMMLAFYLPMVPFILWTFGIIGWLILVIEVLVAAPLWAIGHGMPEGEGFAGPSGKQGYMLFLRVLVRPALMVVGFYVSMVVFNVIGGFIGDGFKLVADTNSSFMGPFALVGYISILTIICVMTTHKIYGLITWLPDNVLNWIAQLHTNLEERQSEGETRNLVLGAVTRQQSAVSGVASNVQLTGKGKDKGNGDQTISEDQNAGVDVAGSRAKHGGESSSQGSGKTDRGRK